MFLISVRAGGIGLNLQNANRVVMFDHTWNPLHEKQAIGRAYRMGQKKRTFVYKLVLEGTCEEGLVRRAIWKYQLAERLVEGKNPVRQGIDFKEFLKDPEPLGPKSDLSAHRELDPQ